MGCNVDVDGLIEELDVIAFPLQRLLQHRVVGLDGKDQFPGDKGELVSEGVVLGPQGGEAGATGGIKERPGEIGIRIGEETVLETQFLLHIAPVQLGLQAAGGGGEAQHAWIGGLDAEAGHPFPPHSDARPLRRLDLSDGGSQGRIVGQPHGDRLVEADPLSGLLQSVASGTVLLVELIKVGILADCRQRVAHVGGQRRRLLPFLNLALHLGLDGQVLAQAQTEQGDRPGLQS